LRRVRSATDTPYHHFYTLPCAARVIYSYCRYWGSTHDPRPTTHTCMLVCVCAGQLLFGLSCHNTLGLCAVFVVGRGFLMAAPTGDGGAEESKGGEPGPGVPLQLFPLPPGVTVDTVVPEVALLHILAEEKRWACQPAHCAPCRTMVWMRRACLAIEWSSRLDSACGRLPCACVQVPRPACHAHPG
jgi:hypothetical protein